MALVRWDSARELASIEVDRLNRMFSELYAENRSRAWMPPVDVYENDQHEVIVKAELPEIKREDINVTFENSVLTVRGERTSDQETGQENYQRRERQHGSFTRSFTVPSTVDSARISASYKDGVLTIRLPQREEAKPKQIPVGE